METSHENSRHQDVFLEVVGKGPFHSFEEFNNRLLAFERLTNTVFIIKTSTSVEFANSRRKTALPTSLKYSTVAYRCVRFGFPRRRGTGQRRRLRKRYKKSSLSNNVFETVESDKDVTSVWQAKPFSVETDDIRPVAIETEMEAVTCETRMEPITSEAGVKTVTCLTGSLSYSAKELLMLLSERGRQPTMGVGIKPIKSEAGMNMEFVTVEEGPKPATVETGAKPVTIDTGAKPVTIDTGAKPVTVETGAKPLPVETRAKPVTVQTGAKPVTIETGTKVVIVESGVRRKTIRIEMGMKAVRIVHFGGEENIKLFSGIPIPTVADDEILIKMKYAGVNPVEVYREEYFPSVNLPFTAGVDGAGVVEKIGGAVTKFSKGDRVQAVLTSGSYAEYTTAKEKHACHLNENISFEQGAGIGVPYYTAYAAVHLRARTEPGEIVLVHGASAGMDVACIQVLKICGCRVICTAGTPEGLVHLKNLGADHVYNHHEIDYTEKIKSEVTDGAGVDVILEMSANVNLHQNDLQLIAARGRIVVIGTQSTMNVDPLLFLIKEAIVTGVNLHALSDLEWHKIHSALSAGLEQGWLRPYIGKVYDMNEAVKAQHDVKYASNIKGKLVINTSNQNVKNVSNIKGKIVINTSNQNQSYAFQGQY